MKVDLPTDAETRLAEHAKAAGYDDVERYAAEHLLAIAQQPMLCELGPLTGQARAESLAMIEEGEADLAAGRTRDVREALLEIGQKFGFRTGG